MWLFVIFGLAFAVLGLAGARGTLSPQVGILSLGGFSFCLICAILLGLRSRQAALEGRNLHSATSMLVLMASMLKDQDDKTLERIASKGGPAGDAAQMLLERRRARLPSSDQSAGLPDGQ
jgi:hypothetical protein